MKTFCALQRRVQAPANTRRNRSRADARDDCPIIRRSRIRARARSSTSTIRSTTSENYEVQDTRVLRVLGVARGRRRKMKTFGIAAAVQGHPARTQHRTRKKVSRAWRKPRTSYGWSPQTRRLDRFGHAGLCEGTADAAGVPRSFDLFREVSAARAAGGESWSRF